jgi:hypothetical protein
MRIGHFEYLSEHALAKRLSFGRAVIRKIENHPEHQAGIWSVTSGARGCIRFWNLQIVHSFLFHPQDVEKRKELSEQVLAQSRIQFGIESIWGDEIYVD